MADITMPQLGETVTEGTITRWFKQVGEAIAEDEVLFEVSTDKVDSEVPSPAAGVLTEILVQEGETVDVGTVLARVGDAASGGVDGQAAPAEQAPAEEAPAAAEPAPAEEAPVEVAEGTGETGSPEVEEAPAQPDEQVPVAAQEPEVSSAPAGGADASATAPTPSGPSAAPADEAPAPAGAAAGGGGDGGGRLLSPVVRRLIAEHGLDPSSITGTGAGGRITRSDVLQVVEGGARGDAAAAVASEATKQLASEDAPAAKGRPLQPAGPAPARAATGPAPAAAGQRDEVVPFTNIRRRTAEHMSRSKATSAHALVVIEVDYDNVDKVRLAEKDDFRAEEGVALTYLPFISRAVVDALREFPVANSSVGDGELVLHHQVNLGYAVDLDFEGLMVPVVQAADSKRMRAIAREVADLADRARRKKLGPDDIAGGTFTITNIGSYGTVLTFPIINQPQVGILSTDGVRKRPVVVELPDGSDAIAIHRVGNLALSWDHRAFDGAYAAAFVAKVKEILETRDWAAELA
jgi:2-oxoglutarate dehydrogenase E2 component (dihydrolipoamide succinyltransferase)